MICASGILTQGLRSCRSTAHMPSSSVRPCLQLLSSRPSAILHNAVAQGHDRNAAPGGAARSPPPPPSSQPAEAGAERCAAEPARRVPPTSGPCFPLPAAGPAGRPAARRSRSPGPGAPSATCRRPGLPEASRWWQPLRIPCTAALTSGGQAEDANRATPTPVRNHV